MGAFFFGIKMGKTNTLEVILILEHEGFLCSIHYIHIDGNKK